MFSYHHHIGDFRRDTASLSDTDAMAYLKLLWMYYDTELPLSSDAKLLAFKIGSNAESVQLILDAFFTLDGNVYRQKRCDAEIAAYYARSDKARDKANKRWRNAAASEGNAIALEGHIYSITAEPEIDANREPITEKKINKPLERPDDISAELWSEFKEHRKRKKSSVTELVIRTLRSEAAKANMSLSQAMEAMIVNGWAGFKSTWVMKDQPTNENNMARRVK
jgi:uncharacterized protein YdaU (DUF1376 family)